MAACILAGTILCAQPRAKNETPQTADASPHTVQFIEVEKDIKLEVLDWGGSGRPLILLAGLGSTAHDFDDFAPKLSASYHVYGITRRGFGASTAPRPDCANYSADRLGDDVLAVMDALKINRPVLVGHSIAGEELSSIGTRFPERVAGLVYLDAGYAYAYYNDHATYGEWMFDTFALQKELGQYGSPGPSSQKKVQLAHLLEVSLPRYEKILEDDRKQLQQQPDNAPGPPDTPQVRINVAILKGFQIYKGVRCPVLAIFADPHAPPPNAPTDPVKRASMIADDLAHTSAQADAFQSGNPSAHVVRLANAAHFVFRSNEADVLREINAFVAQLP
jgi:pimeloyl-ACP methyl ester carboxylesterase